MRSEKVDKESVALLSILFKNIGGTYLNTLVSLVDGLIREIIGGRGGRFVVTGDFREIVLHRVILQTFSPGFEIVMTKMLDPPSHTIENS